VNPGFAERGTVGGRPEVFDHADRDAHRGSSRPDGEVSAPPLPYVLLAGLPASGKSELRRYLASLDPSAAARFGLGPTLHLDDYPYVHTMRLASRALRAAGLDPVFFEGDELPFRDPVLWIVLTRLLAEDVATLGSGDAGGSEPARWLLDRIDRQLDAVGLGARFPAGSSARAVAADGITDFAEELRRERRSIARAWDGSQTVLIEFARGGPQGSSPPLPYPLGYRWSLPEFPRQVLGSAGILYVWVTPTESLRRNRERARPGGAASILHHGVPEEVMRREYGTDDLLWLLEQNGGRAVVVETHRERIEVPAAVFDNRTDHTSFLRDDPATWPADAVAALHRRLEAAFAEILDQRAVR